MLNCLLPLRVRVAAAAFLLCAATADAGLVSLDWKAQGDGLLTLDTVSGLRWLDFSETRAVSVGLLDSGSPWLSGGFRYATPTEVEGLFSSAGLSNSGSYNTADYLPSVDFVRLFNTAGTAPGRTFASAWLPGPTAPKNHPVWLMSVGLASFPVPDVEGYSWVTQISNDVPPDLSPFPYGHALVQTGDYVPPGGTPVPEPAGTLGLLADVVSGLTIYRSIRRTRTVA